MGLARAGPRSLARRAVGLRATGRSSAAHLRLRAIARAMALPFGSTMESAPASKSAGARTCYHHYPEAAPAPHVTRPKLEPPWPKARHRSSGEIR